MVRCLPLGWTVNAEIEKKTEEFQEKVKLFNHKDNFGIGDHVKSADIPDYELTKIVPESTAIYLSLNNT